MRTSKRAPHFFMNYTRSMTGTMADWIVAPLSAALAIAVHLRLAMPASACAIISNLAIGDGLHVPPLAYLSAFCIVWLVYLIDADPQVSPEDRTGHPTRFCFHKDHARSLKILISVLAALACLTSIILLASVVGFPWWAIPFSCPVLLYVTPAVRPLRHLPKLKMLTGSKTLWVSVCWWIGAWAVASCWDAAFRWTMLLSLPSLALLLKLFVETLVRDMIDAPEDLVHGVRSMGQSGMASLLLATAGCVAVIAFVVLSFPIGRAMLLSALTVGLLIIAVLAKRGLSSDRAKGFLDLVVVPWYAMF
jgi:hypothetical protein